jgi:hypothetical protein
MATSPPDPDPRTAPHEERLDTLAALTDAIDRVIALATSKLSVFDCDLSDGGWSSAARAQALESFLRLRTARLSLIVHDTRHLETSCPRIVALLKVYGHAMQVWRTGVEARSASDALFIADDRHYVHRYHVDQPRATLAIAMPAEAKPLVARFDEIWATGEPALGGSVLGL